MARGKIKWKSAFNWIKWIFAHEFKHFRFVSFRWYIVRAQHLINFGIGSCNCSDTTMYTFFLSFIAMAIATKSTFLIWLLHTHPQYTRYRAGKWKPFSYQQISFSIILHSMDYSFVCFLSATSKQIQAQYREQLTSQSLIIFPFHSFVYHIQPFIPAFSNDHQTNLARPQHGTWSMICANHFKHSSHCQRFIENWMGLDRTWMVYVDTV